MQLQIRGGESTLMVEATGDEEIRQIKDQVATQEGIAREEVTLYCNGSPLDDTAKVNELSGRLIEAVMFQLLGGKVHGSLARAGKVKGQTPKVEKQDKKKKKTGRAKRRIQYNRRFVNVVQGFGRRRGPNANS